VGEKNHKQQFQRKGEKSRTEPFCIKPHYTISTIGGL
jgi:hypothetical protein